MSCPKHKAIELAEAQALQHGITEAARQPQPQPEPEPQPHTPRQRRQHAPIRPEVQQMLDEQQAEIARVLALSVEEL